MMSTGDDIPGGRSGHRPAPLKPNTEENRVFDREGEPAYIKLQFERLEVPAREGVAFQLVMRSAREPSWEVRSDQRSGGGRSGAGSAIGSRSRTERVSFVASIETGRRWGLDAGPGRSPIAHRTHHCTRSTDPHRCARVYRRARMSCNQDCIPIHTTDGGRRS